MKRRHMNYSKKYAHGKILVMLGPGIQNVYDASHFQTLEFARDSFILL